MNGRPLRKIRSFVKRPGRITTAQKRALERLWPRWGIPFREQKLDLDAVFGRRAPRVLDIGFGDGEALLTAAANNRAIDYLGVEVHEPGIGHLLVLIERAALDNIRIVQRDAVEVVAHMLEPSTFDAINLFFPDPWPKKRHHKRRLVQPAFAAALTATLKPGGLLHLATDWADYGEHMRAVLGACTELVAELPERLAADPLAFRPPTKFELRGRRLGHEVTELCYRKRRKAA
ncbi:MAG TPA: tRNA (guanosine(46)-N7)-methyltransferase TrmB [Gammaproteobacteria bacterium]|jgi:tRNA (guanine-N7-)-methyltransferase